MKKTNKILLLFLVGLLILERTLTVSAMENIEFENSFEEMGEQLVKKQSEEKNDQLDDNSAHLLNEGNAELVDSVIDEEMHLKDLGNQNDIVFENEKTTIISDEEFSSGIEDEVVESDNNAAEQEDEVDTSLDEEDFEIELELNGDIEVEFEMNEANISDKYTTISVRYDQNNARKMLLLINNLRTGNEAWYYDEYNEKKNIYGLRPLKYDYDLEAIAMLRAAEIAIQFAHSRPNGTSCFAAYDLIHYGKMACAENIAFGYVTAENVFKAWKEDDKLYVGQGHRRNMLGDYSAIGIGHCVYNGRHYWVQEFSIPQNDVNTSYSTYINNSVLNDSANVKIYTNGVGEFSILPMNEKRKGGYKTV